VESTRIDDLIVTLNREGAREYSKVSFPIRYGRFSEIQTPHHLFQFNLNGEIKFIQGRTRDWPHRAEWLKRTVANDWVYYSAGDYAGIYELVGEHYLPCLSYPSNPFLDEDPFGKEPVRTAIHACRSLIEGAEGLAVRVRGQEFRDFFHRLAANDEEALGQRSEIFHRLLGGEITVLPPDTRHVDYEAIPIVVADGCLYHCRFCEIKKGEEFAPRTPENILGQIENLKLFYGEDIRNYNAVFLGQHDALCAGRDFLEWAAREAFERFDFKHSYLTGARLFLFGSPDSLVDSEEALFESLNRLPFYTYINVGLESADRSTLALLGKPVAAERVHETFRRMLEINRKYERIEVTANFVYGDDLPADHLPSLLKLVRDRTSFFHNKGTLYLSPLMRSENERSEKRREWLRGFQKVKAQSPLPTFAYLIQRL
jgi:radical SAM superfamily enzyme YgiQ (UPF0313 family)